MVRVMCGGGSLAPWPSRIGARLQSATRRFESARCLAERRTEMTRFEIVEQGTILRATVDRATAVRLRPSLRREQD
jgi:hypothetical protein